MADVRLCSVPDCCNPLYARGFCYMHWRRWRTHGDPSRCDRPRAASGAPLRWIDDALKDAQDECLPWPFSRMKNGYPRIRIEGKSVSATRYVCLRKRGEPPTPEHHAAHRCGHVWCANPNHLRWRTKSENEQEKKTHGTDNRGSSHGMAVLAERQVEQIDKALDAGRSQASLAREFGVSKGCINGIKRGNNWSWLTGR